MARLWSDRATEGDAAACARWRAAHPDHAQAWARMQAMEDKLAAVPSDIARHALLEPKRPVASARRGAMRLLGLAIVGAGASYAVRRTDTWQAVASTHSTRTGEIREIVLSDGTRIVLDTATALDIHFDGSERRVLLRSGEILVTTAPDPASIHRPFRVQSRQGTIEALGTRFTVRQDAETSQVAVFEGAVELRPVHASDAARRLDAGQRASFSSDRVAQPVAASEQAAAWSKGRLVTEDMRVGDFVAELARYRVGLLRCDPAVADLRVTGVFSLRDTDRALINLTLGLPIEVVYRTRYWVTVQAR